MLRDMAENGVELIQLHEEWNDSIRRFGADKFSCFDPQGLQKFIDLCHCFGIKVIPFMQFPLLTTRGRPLMGKRVEENIPYYGNTEEKLGIEFAFNKRVGEYMKAHPDGPYVYSLWSAIPDDPEEYPRWCKYLELYKPMVEENSLAYIELRACGDILSQLPENVYVSMFVNEKMYLAASNLTDKAYTLVLKDNWRDRVTGKVSNTFTIESGKISFLVKE